MSVIFIRSVSNIISDRGFFHLRSTICFLLAKANLLPWHASLIVLWSRSVISKVIVTYFILKLKVRNYFIDYFTVFLSGIKILKISDSIFRLILQYFLYYRMGEMRYNCESL